MDDTDPMLELLAQAASPTTVTGSSPSGLWLAGAIGVGSLVFAIVRHSKRVARGREADAPVSDVQRRWAAEKARQKGGKGPARGTATPASHETESTEIDDRIAELRRLIADADDRIQELKGLARTQTAAQRAPHSAASRSEPKGTSHWHKTDSAAQRIFELADDGFSPRQIAAQTGQSESEINLTLALRH